VQCNATDFLENRILNFSDQDENDTCIPAIVEMEGVIRKEPCHYPYADRLPMMLPRYEARQTGGGCYAGCKSGSVSVRQRFTSRNDLSWLFIEFMFG